MNMSNALQIETTVLSKVVDRSITQYSKEETTEDKGKPMEEAIFHWKTLLIDEKMVFSVGHRRKIINFRRLTRTDGR
jgi:hypothetical protein